MEEILTFLQTYGWQLGLIAVAGILLLGLLKYAGLFKSIDEKYRHYIYLGISIGISVIAAIIYLACVGQLTFSFACVVAGAIYALNQTFYNIFDITPVNEILEKLLDFVIVVVKTKILKQNIEDATEETTEEDTQNENS